MGIESFNMSSRSTLFAQLAAREWDLLVIGGGITGASTFRDAALRGVNVALLEARDFASGTSSRSSKLIHGGLRYLKNLGFRLTREACQERNLQIRLNRRLVRPVPFLVPIYSGRGESRAKLRLGMLLYEALSGFRNQQFHRFLSREETLLLAPGLPVDGLTGGCCYHDATVSDHRLTLETIKDGVRHGGLAVNYAAVTGLVKQDGRVAGADFTDQLTGTAYQVRSRVVVNATGVFADRIRRLADPAAAPLVRLSKGTHFVFRQEDVPLSITTVFNSPIDGRPLFLARHEDCFLYGTTDDWEESDPAAPGPGEKDVRYLLDSLQRFMPGANLGPEHVQFVYSGFRPLLATGAAPERPSDATREDLVEDAPSGLISVVGGKLTTARLMALRVLDRVRRQLPPGSPWAPSRTHRESLGGANEELAESLASWAKRCPRLTGYFRILHDRYGLDADGVCAEVLKIHRGEHPDPRAEPLRAEVQYVCRHEMVCTVEDLLERRAGFLYWNPAERLERLRHGAHVIRHELSLSEEAFEDQFRAYGEHLREFHALPISR